MKARPVMLDFSNPAAPPDLLLATKLYVPPVRPGLVSRPRLLARLNEGLDRRLTLISAPAGFGKTTLLAEWAQGVGDRGQGIGNRGQGLGNRDRGLTWPPPSGPQPPPSGPRVAWVSLDSRDNDTARFLAYVLAALETVGATISEPVLATLRSAAPFLLEPLLTRLVNDLAALPADVVLILDDTHLLDARPIHDAVALLIEQGPPQLHLVLAGRAEPFGLPLARLRAQCQLVELGPADLRFTSAEAADFLNRVMGLDLSPGDVAALEARTEGWIAGLQLAALSMQGRTDRASFLAGFTGSHRYILDYLAEEVLLRQPGPVRAFLLQTSILTRLCAPLCDAVVGREGSREMLAYLEKNNLFLVPLDDERRWYRYHHLFADLLRQHLRQAAPGLAGGIAELHRRACGWYERQGLAAEAMGHALSAADVEGAARLVRQAAQPRLSSSEMATLLSWLDVLPGELTRATAHLSLFHAWALLLTGHVEGLEPPGESGTTAAAAALAALPGELAAIQATAAYFRRDFPRAIELSQGALASLAEDNLFLRGVVALNLGVACSWTGELAAATRAFREASAVSQSLGNKHAALVALWHLGQLAEEQGHLHEAAGLYQQAIDLATHLPAAGGAYAGLAGVLYEWNRLEEAEANARTGIDLAAPGAEVGMATVGYLGLARLHAARGDREGAREMLAQAEGLARRQAEPYWLAQIAAGRLRLELGPAFGEPAAAVLEEGSQWARARGLDDEADPVYLRTGEYFSLARLLLARGQQQPAGPFLDTAAHLLARLAKTAASTGRQGWQIEALALQALVLQAQNRLEPALDSLAQALGLAEPEGYFRLFIDEGPPMATLLRRAASHRLMPGTVGRLLDGFDALRLVGESPPAVVEPLSERELEILKLIALGLSNQEIAGRLVLTIGTVKWYLNTIYGKLGVRSRTQALAQARALKLLR